MKMFNDLSKKKKTLIIIVIQVIIVDSLQFTYIFNQSSLNHRFFLAMIHCRVDI